MFRESIKVDIPKRFKYAFNIFNGFFIRAAYRHFIRKKNRSHDLSTEQYFFMLYESLHLYVVVSLLPAPIDFFSRYWNRKRKANWKRRVDETRIRRFNVTSFVHANLPLSITRGRFLVIIYCQTFHEIFSMGFMRQLRHEAFIITQMIKM